jgi:hypothetical protein
MAKHTAGGAFYSTEDLIRMATLGQFGQMSNVAGRAFTRLRQLEVENAELRQRVVELENVQTVADSQYPTEVSVEDNDGEVDTNPGNLYNVDY